MPKLFVDLKRLIVPDAVYFVTANTQDNFQFFKERIFCDVFVEELRMCKRLKDFKLFAWSLGYDHFHLLVQPGDEWNISEVMHCLKRHATRNINIIMGYKSLSPVPAGSDGPPVGSDGHPSLPAGCGIDISPSAHMDLFVIRKRITFFLKHNNKRPFPKFKWQKSFYDHRARNEHEMDRIWEYIRWNPEHHNLPWNWPYIFTNPKFNNLLDEYG